MNNSIILQNLTRQDLIDIFEGVLVEKLNDFTPPPARKTEYLTRKEVAALLRISIPTLHELIKTGKLKGYRIGGRVLFNKSEVEESLEEIESQKYKRS